MSTTTEDRITEARWRVDFLNVCERLISRDEIGVVYDSDGTPFRYVNPQSPLVDIYNELRTVGYARGWL